MTDDRTVNAPASDRMLRGKSKRGAILTLLAALFLSPFAHAAATRTEIIASAAFTTSGNSAAISTATATQLMVGVDVTAQSGTTPVLDLWLQVSDDGGTTWYDMPADLTLKTANTAGTGTLSSSPGARDIVDNLSAATGQFLGIYKHIATDRVRLKWIISGTTPSFTFSASMVAK